MSKDKRTSDADDLLSNKGMSRNHPNTKDALLAEEYFFHIPGARFVCVLTSFTFFVHGVAASVDVPTLAATGWSGVEVVGVVGTIFGKEGLFAQSGWFSNYNLDWCWLRLANLVKIEVLCDPRFRRGDACVWMSTQRGDYAMLLLHMDYTNEWEDALCSLGVAAAVARFTQLPARGPRPTWWPNMWKEHWPFDEASLERASPAESEDEPALSRLASHAGWRRLGPAGDERCSAGYLSNLGQLEAWRIEPDTGMLPTHRVASTSKNGKRNIDRPPAGRGSIQRRRGRPSKR
ncbi:hypothetical protein FS749_015426 [Ceratobasidium sp. UAMH 11750]|nr:hypothetical protein FS749_015426 [Ceratobasidium sp. UAMH 11750]